MWKVCVNKEVCTWGHVKLHPCRSVLYGPRPHVLSFLWDDLQGYTTLTVKQVSLYSEHLFSVNVINSRLNAAAVFLCVCVWFGPEELKTVLFKSQRKDAPPSPSELRCDGSSLLELQVYKVNYVLSEFHDLWALETCKEKHSFLPQLKVSDCVQIVCVAPVRQRPNTPRAQPEARLPPWEVCKTRRVWERDGSQRSPSVLSERDAVNTSLHPGNKCLFVVNFIKEQAP